MDLNLVCVCGGPNSDPIIIEHFVKHYRDVVGVTRFFMFVHYNDEFTDRLHELGLGSESIATFSEPIKTCLFNKVIAEHPNTWTLTCDMDEFHDYGGRFEEVVKDRPTDLDHVHGYLVDRFDRECKCRLLTDQPIAEQFPLRARFTRNVLKACDTKIMAVKNVAIGTGHHVCFGKSGFGPLFIDHYKWDGSAVPRLARSRGNATSDNEAKIFMDLYDQGKLTEAILGSEIK